MRIRKPDKIDVHIHTDSPERAGVLDAILAQITALTRQGEQLMSKADDANLKLDRINTATNNIAEDIRTLKVSAGMTQAEADAVNERLEATATALEGIAAETPEV